MDKKYILSLTDHTLLSPTATERDILAVCDDGIRFGCASVCIPNTHIRAAADYAEGRIKICAVIGFPLGYSLTSVKLCEAAAAAEDGASELDMLANICRIKEGRYDLVLDDIKAVRQSAPDAVLKVIIETCLLAEDEKKAMCEIVSRSGADFIKTSTGFAGGGATREDVALFAANIGDGLRIKAAGGIRSFDDAKAFISLGASRLGTSSLVKLMKNEATGSG